MPTFQPAKVTMGTTVWIAAFSLGEIVICVLKPLNGTPSNELQCNNLRAAIQRESQATVYAVRDLRWLEMGARKLRWRCCQGAPWPNLATCFCLLCVSSA